MTIKGKILENGRSSEKKGPSPEREKGILRRKGT